MKSLRVLLLCAALCGVACANTDAPDSVVATADLGSGKADWAPITIEYGEMTFSLEPEIVPTELDDGTPAFALRGRTNRYMSGGGSYLRAARDEEPTAIGTYTQRNRQAFDVKFTRAELVTLLRGEDLILTFDPQREDLGAHVMRIGVRGRIANFRGGQVNAMLELRPVMSDGQVRHRLEAAVAGRAYSRTLFVEDTFLAATPTSESNFFFDVSTDDLLDAVSAGSTFEIWGNGEGTFAVVNSFAEVSQTDRGAHAWYRSDDCYRSTENCLNGLADGARDLSACGDPKRVVACQADHGVFVDEAAVDAAVDAAPLTMEDATAFIGAARADAFYAGALAHLRAQLETRAGDWYLDADARTASLAEEAERAVGHSYGYPFELVEPTAGPATNGAEAADLCADALLQHVKTEDLYHNEYSAPYFDVVIRSRDEHIRTIAALRRGDNDLDSEPYIESSFDRAEGPWGANLSWLGAYIEVHTDPSGNAPRVYFEVD